MNNWLAAAALERFWVAVALELAVVFLVAHGFQGLLRRGSARRMLWQVAFVAAVLVVWLEACGAGELAARWGRGQFASRFRRPPTDKALVTSSLRGVVVTEQPQGSASLVPGFGPSVQSKPTALAWASALWLAGVAAWVLRMGVGRLAFHWFARPRPLGDPQTLEAVRMLAQALGVRRQLRVVEIEGLSGPITYGLFRPAIGLPPRFVDLAGAAQREAMLAHELAHVAGGDVWWQLLSDLVAAVLWWHPLVWTARRSFRNARELAADEASLLVEGGPAALAESLVALGGRLARSRPVAWLGTEGVSFRSGLGRRVTRLIGLTRTAYGPVGRPVVIGVWTSGPVLLAGLALLVALWTRWDTSRGAELDTAFRSSLVGLTLAAVVGPQEPESRTSPSNQKTPGPGAVGASTEEARSKEATDQTVYIIQDGDTLSSIVRQARAAGQPITQKQLMEANPNVQWTRLRVGQQILVPGLVSAAASPRPAALAQIAPRPSSTSGPERGPTAIAPAATPTPLHTRWFKVEDQQLRFGLRGWLGLDAASAMAEAKPETLISDLRQLFFACGVDLTLPGRQLLLNERTGMLLVRATLVELEEVQLALQALNTAPAQVLLELKLCEASEEAAAQLSGQLGGGLADLLRPGGAAPGTPGNTLTSILTDTQAGVLLRAMEAQRGVNLLTAPKVTTLSGRQAQVKTVSVRYIVTDLDLQTNAAPASGVKSPVTNSSSPGSTLSIQPVTQPFELGPVIDLVPTVQADGQTIALTVVASIKEFLGYDNAEGMDAILRQGGETAATQRTPLPHFRLRQVVGSAVVRHGQTLVLSGGTIQEERVGETGGSPKSVPAAIPTPGVPGTESGRKTLLILVTPRIIDPAGNSVSP